MPQRSGGAEDVRARRRAVQLSPGLGPGKTDHIRLAAAKAAAAIIQRSGFVATAYAAAFNSARSIPRAEPGATLYRAPTRAPREPRSGGTSVAHGVSRGNEIVPIWEPRSGDTLPRRISSVSGSGICVQGSEKAESWCEKSQSTPAISQLGSAKPQTRCEKWKHECEKWKHECEKWKHEC